MTLNDFIKTIPSTLTTGQHFYDLYYNYLCENSIRFRAADIESLYFEKDPHVSVIKLLGIMKYAKWEELPDVT